MSQNGKLMPNLDQHSTKALNLTVLQRVDQFVEEILITAAHVTLYEFNIDLGQWSRKDVEGSLFVVKRNVQPRFQFIVMNRRNTENLVENLLGDFEYEIQAPYLLYRNASQEVNGIWFYNPQECDEVAKLFSRILSAYAKVPTKLSVPSGKSEFEELEAVPTNAVMDGPLEPSSVNTSDVTDIPSDHLLANFFGGTDREAVKNCFDKKKPPVYRKVVAAMNFGSGTSGTIIPPPSHPPSVPPAVPAAPMSASSNVFLENSSGHLSKTASLVKPSFFNTQPPPVTCSNIPTAPPLNPYAPNLQQQQSYGGTPIRQPFPPPTPSPALTPIPAVPTHTYGPLITRESVRKALLILAQDDQVIDKVHHALLNAHDS